MEQNCKLQKYLALSIMGFTLPAYAADKPNIIVILADDMGYSDIGCYGGEISTPNIDDLAENGIRYTNFYNGARSCPTRASLLTGLYPHQAGMGWMTTAFEGDGSYQGDLSKNAITIAEYLKIGGYNTYMTGKWHLSNHRKNDESIKDSWPMQSGFDRYFGIIGGASNFFTPTLCSNNIRHPAPADFYLTDGISDSASVYIRENNDQPFFMYVAYTAPHWPLHAKPEDIAKYDGKYDIGWDKVRENRLKKQKEIGLIDDKYTLTPRDAQVNSWNAERNKSAFAKRMQIYAAQVEVMDRGIGKIINALKETGQYENTMIMFLSDNGASSEYISSGQSKELTGAADTYESYQINWANASNTPYREYKSYAHEGGIKTPFVVQWPNGITKQKGSFVHTTGHVIDIFKTIEEITGISYPNTFNGNTIIPLQGESMLPLFNGNERDRGPLFWEHESNIAVRLADWKLVVKTPTGSTPLGKLELYNLADDPTELNDLSGTQAQKAQELWNMWYQWAEENSVFPLSTLSYGDRKVYEKRYLNGEFNAGLAEWTFSTSGTGEGSVNLDISNKISGKYSARVTVNNTGEKPNNILLHWKLPLKKGERCKVRFKAKSDIDDVNILLRLEKNGDNYAKVIDVPLIINKTTKTYEFDSEIIPANEEYRIGFYFGESAPSNVWLDAVELIFINNPSPSTTWDFNAVSGISYTISFNGLATQFQVPVNVLLRNKEMPEQIYYSSTIMLTKVLQHYNLDIPDPEEDEKLYLEFEIPPYATNEIAFSNLQLNVNNNTAIHEVEKKNEYAVHYRDNKYLIVPEQLTKRYSFEVFNYLGKLVEQQCCLLGEVKLNTQNSGTYILRIKEVNKIKFVRKLVIYNH
jgi:arylsulfatase A-like enzyme